jgi:hypothetical protein
MLTANHQGVGANTSISHISQLKKQDWKFKVTFQMFSVHKPSSWEQNWVCPEARPSSMGTVVQ